MADNKPINWSYPFKTAGEESKDVSDPQIYLDALAKAKDGFYPMGANGLWHGGIHFDDNTAGSLNQSAIRCIADGEVIAYRVDQRYPTTQYGDGPTVVHLPFSTGFVLVRHRLEVPPLPVPSAPAGEASGTAAVTPTDPAAPATTDSEAAPAREALTFYSLYMHLLDWAGYEATGAPEPAEFLAPTSYAVKPTTNDPLMGLRVRALSEDGSSEVLALLPKGCKVTVGEAHSVKPQYKKLLSIDDGAAIPAIPSDTVGWVYEAELTGNTVADKATDTEPTLTLSHQGLRVRKEGKGTGSIIGVLPRGAMLKVGEKQRSGYCKVLEVTDYRGVPALPSGSDGKPLGYVFFESLETKKTNPSAFDSVHLLPKPYVIKAGELVGHIGRYQNHNESTAKQRLHLEVFTCEDVPAFIEKSRAVGEKLPDDQRTLIKVDKGSKIVQPVAADAHVEAGVDVRLCSDSSKNGCWVKVQKYTICNADKNSELGTYNSTKLTYTLSVAQKTTLASRMGVDATDMPDQVDFLKVYSNSLEGGDAHDYESGSIPTTHTWRKVGAMAGKPFWVKRSALNAQGRRTSMAGSLDAWTEFPLHSGLEGKASGYVRILPASSWEALPDERKAVDAEKVPWWYVTVGDMEGNDISGWAPEKDLIVTRHSPWEWPGFSTLRDNLSLDAHLARTLDATGRATEEETASYAALIEEAERGTILSKLYEIIDQPDEKGVRDNKLTPAEFQAALAKPWLAQQLSLLISQHESEWFWNESKWNQLDTLMEHTPEDPNIQWVREKDRIKKLSWWKELAGQPGIAADGGAWHFQPISFIASFSRKSSDLITLEMLKKAKSSVGEEYYNSVLPYLNKYARIYKVDTPLVLAHFLSQVGHESGFKVTSEDLNFSAGRMRAVFGCRGNLTGYNESTNECITLPRLRPKLWSEEATYEHNAENLGNYVYASRNGNGDESSGDGYRYRGRGIIQLTGRANYEAYNRIHNEKNPADPQDFISNPDLIIGSLDYGIESAFVWWDMNRMNKKIEVSYAVRGEEKISDHVADISEAVNGGSIGLTERVELFKALRTIIKEEHGL